MIARNENLLLVSCKRTLEAFSMTRELLHLKATVMAEHHPFSFSSERHVTMLCPNLATRNTIYVADMPFQAVGLTTAVQCAMLIRQLYVEALVSSTYQSTTLLNGYMTARIMEIISLGCDHE